tara:strand:+ start:196 stop:579 length:384 start_codon:yes stop_codon:yes gene_type:complete
MIIRDEYDIIKFIANVLKKLDLSKTWEIIVREYDPKKTNPQCALYWSWVDEIRKATGNHKACQDEELRKYFLKPEIYVNTKGVTKEYYPRVSDMGKKQMSEFMNEVFIMGTNLGHNLKDPAELQRNQ